MSIEWLTSCLKEQARLLRDEIVRVSQKDHPYPEPDIVYTVLLRVLDSRLSTLQEWYDLPSSAPFEEGKVEPILSELAKELGRVAEILSLARRVDSSRIPFEVIDSLSWVAHSLLKTECRAIVRLDPEFNYTISSVRDIFAQRGFEFEWDETVTDNPNSGTFLLFGFPSPAAGSILLHALAAHELGHILSAKFFEDLDTAGQEAMDKARSEFQDELAEYIEERLHKQRGVGLGDSFEKLRDTVENRLHQIASSWISELLADLIAVRLVGPAFFAAFDRIALDPLSSSDSHPPVFLRRLIGRQYLLQRFPEIGGDPVWEHVLTASRVTRPYDLLWQVGLRACEVAVDKLNLLADRVRSPFVDMRRVQTTLASMYDHIDNLSPPSMALRGVFPPDDADSFWLVLYAAWHFRLNKERFAGFCTTHGWDREGEQGEDALGNLVVHSLKSLELHSRWNSMIRARQE